MTMTFGEAVYAARMDARMNQVEFATLLGVGSSTVSTWETGRELPRPGAMYRVCDALNLKVKNIRRDPRRGYPVSIVVEKQRMCEPDANPEKPVEKAPSMAVVLRETGRRYLCIAPGGVLSEADDVMVQTSNDEPNFVGRVDALLENVTTEARAFIEVLWSEVEGKVIGKITRFGEV